MMFMKELHEITKHEITKYIKCSTIIKNSEISALHVVNDLKASYARYASTFGLYAVFVPIKTK